MSKALVLNSIESFWSYLKFESIYKARQITFPTKIYTLFLNYSENLSNYLDEQAVKEETILLFKTAKWLVVLGFNATLTAKVISWRSVTHMCFLAFSHSTNTTFLSKATDYFSHVLLQR